MKDGALELNCSPTILKDQFDDAKILIKEATKLYNKVNESSQGNELTQVNEKYEVVVHVSFNQMKRSIAPVLEKIFCLSKSSLTEKEADSKTQIKLPKLELDKFCGDLRAYPAWKSTFQEHISPQYSVPQQILALKNYLSVKIKEEIKNYNSVEMMWHYLDRKYGDERKLLDAVFNDLKSLSQCSDSDGKKTVKLIETVLKKRYV